MCNFCIINNVCLLKHSSGVVAAQHGRIQSNLSSVFSGRSMMALFDCLSKPVHHQMISTLTTLLFVFLFTLSSVECVTASVRKLTAADFDTFIENEPLTMIEFFAPWCGHCKALAPKYEAAAKQLESGEKPIHIGSVDCVAETSLCLKHGVKGYPTLKVFTNEKNAKPIDYPGGRETEDIVRFLTKFNQPAYRECHSVEDVEQLVKNNPVTVLGFFTDKESKEAQNFLDVALRLRNDYSFGFITESSVLDELRSKYALTTMPAIIVSVENQEIGSAMTENLDDVDAVLKFIDTEGFPLVSEIGPLNFQKLSNRGLPFVWTFLDETSDLTEPVLRVMHDVALEFKGRLSVVKLDGKKYERYAKHFGLKDDELPGILIEDRNARKNYIYDTNNDITTKNLSKFFSDFFAGTLTPNLKSQNVPKPNDGPVTVVVGKNFDEVVMDNDRDVLVEFYAPWCGHCKALAPKYEQLGKLFELDDSIVIAQVDATENDTPAEIQGFPTIMLYPAGDKKNPILYSGERSVEDLAHFVRDNAKALKSNVVDAKEEAHGHGEL